MKSELAMALQSLHIAAGFSTSSSPPRISSYSMSRAQSGSIRVSLSYRNCPLATTSSLESETDSNSDSATRSKPFLQCSRRPCISLCAASILLAVRPGSVLAEENVKKEEGGSFVDGVLELLDPDQITKTGKKLPKKYVKSVREVVKNLKESFAQDSNDGAKFRRNADSAKEAIREYLQDWRGSKIVETEDSYKALERAFRELGKFYSSKGPQAVLPEDIRNRVLEDLNKADDSI